MSWRIRRGLSEASAVLCSVSPALCSRNGSSPVAGQPGQAHLSTSTFSVWEWRQTVIVAVRDPGREAIWHAHPPAEGKGDFTEKRD